MAEYAKPRGTADILPDVASSWRAIEETARRIFEQYHFREMRTPIFEHTELFLRGVGDTTDIVQKEMYTFTDRGNRQITLRPEGTAGVVRAFVEQKLYGGPLPQKFYYYGPMFRYEKPQAGRFRQLHQYGVEVIGSDDPRVDAEVIELADRFLRANGVSSMRLELNSVGCPTCRERHKAVLLAHLAPVKDALCHDCQSRYEKNPLRILDCKIDRDNPVVKSSPTITEYLCESCAAHFSQVKQYLDILEVPYVVNPTMVRGLDYYTQTAFEFMEDSIGAMSTILAGGRYNGLVAMLGGPEMPGIGFAGGMERLLLARAANGITEQSADQTDVYVMGMGAASLPLTVRIVRDLRAAGIAADADYTSRSMKAQMKTADRLRARVAIIVGEDEAAAESATVRNMESKEQTTVALADIVSHVQALLANR